MSRCTLRLVLTVLLYAGVVVALFPYVTGHMSSAFLFLAAGITFTVLCGVLRCYLTEGDCTDRVPSRPASWTGPHQGTP